MSSFDILKRILIYAFVVVNIFTVLYMNRPVFLIQVVNKIVDNHTSAVFTYKLKLFSWYIKSYAHIVGLDNKWQMFGRQSRFNWWYLIKAKYDDSKTIALALPRQTPRNFLERNLIDFKEGKFHLNLYNNEIGRETYSRYLCRQFSNLNGSPIQSIIFELWYQNILPPEEAEKKGKYLDPNVYSQVLNEFKCHEAEKQ